MSGAKKNVFPNTHFVFRAVGTLQWMKPFFLLMRTPKARRIAPALKLILPQCAFITDVEGVFLSAAVQCDKNM